MTNQAAGKFLESETVYKGGEKNGESNLFLTGHNLPCNQVSPLAPFRESKSSKEPVEFSTETEKQEGATGIKPNQGKVDGSDCDMEETEAVAPVQQTSSHDFPASGMSGLPQFSNPSALQGHQQAAS